MSAKDLVVPAKVSSEISQENDSSGNPQLTNTIKRGRGRPPNSERDVSEKIVPENPQLTDAFKRPMIRTLGKTIGRPLGAKAPYNKDSIKRLEELGFDPIEKMIECHRDIRVELERQKRLQKDADTGVKKTDGTAQTSRYSAMAHANLLSIEEKLLNDIIPYRYSKVPIEVDVKTNALPPIFISLTQEGDIYEINPEDNVDSSDQVSLAYKGEDE